MRAMKLGGTVLLLACGMRSCYMHAECTDVGQQGFG